MSQPNFGQVWGWSPTLEKVGNLESSRTPECSELDSKAQNTLHWGVLDVIGKVLKRRYRKWPCISHSDICSTSYGQKKGRESNWQFDSRPLKVGNRPFSDVTLRVQHGVGKISTAVQSSGSLVGTVSGLHFGSPNKMCHLDVASATSCREYYRGVRWWLTPKSGPWWVTTTYCAFLQREKQKIGRVCEAKITCNMCDVTRIATCGSPTITNI